MKKVIKWVLIIGGSVLVVWILNKYRKCNTKGNESGKPFECNPFSSEPSFLVAEEIRHMMQEGKCYEITDYGKKMSFREVEKEFCNQ